ncbi:MAG: type II toxin-antitoxin system RelE/ParE family toxin [Nitrospiraceae bacterium]
MELTNSGYGAQRQLRVFYLVKLANTIVVFHGFHKKNQKTPTHGIAIGRQRLQEIFHGYI